MVRIQPFDLPKSDSKTVAPTSIVVTIEQSGRHTLNDKDISPKALERAIRREVRDAENKESLTITIVAEIGTPFDRVVDVMEIAGKLRINAIIATQPKS